MDSVHLYAGPSLYGLDPRTLVDAGIDLHPPIRRGDVDALLQTCKRTSVIIVCDGVFQSTPAVSHAELCNALDNDWQVWGVSSIGAIRAFELRHEGMKGFGYVYRQLGEFQDFTDDEMCLLHFPEAPYFPVSEPLVNLRFALEQNRTTLDISAEMEHSLIAQLRMLWFGDRTLATMRKLMVESAGFGDHVADALLGWLDSNRIKALDLANLLAERPWASSTSRT